MIKSRLQVMLNQMEQEDYYLSFRLVEGLELAFEKRKRGIPENLLVISSDGEYYRMPLRHRGHYHDKPLEDMAKLQKKEDINWIHAVEKRVSDLKMLSSVPEEIRDLYKAKIQEADAIVRVWRKDFYESIDQVMENVKLANNLIEHLTKEEDKKAIIEMISQYSEFYEEKCVSWMHLQRASFEFHESLKNDACYLARNNEGKLAFKIMEIANFYNHISEKTYRLKEDVKELAVRRLFMYSIIDETNWQPHIESLNEQINKMLAIKPS